MFPRNLFIAPAVLAATFLSACGNGGGGGGDNAAAAPVATTQLVNDVNASSTSETTVPISINALSFSNTLDRSDTALPVSLD